VQEGCTFVRNGSRVRAREDLRGRLTPQLGDREPRVLPSRQRRGPLLDEAAHQRPVLVQRGPTGRVVLLEGERQLRALVELAVQLLESPEAETPERMLEMRRANGHASAYAPGEAFPALPSGRAEPSRAEVSSQDHPPRADLPLAPGTPVGSAVGIALAP
jgi:hypothetical protein